MNKKLLTLLLFSAFSSASNWDELNEIVWQSEAVIVSKNSVIPVPEECADKARIELGDSLKTDTLLNDNEKIFLITKFSADKSPDGKYWVIDSSVKCESVGYKCITMDYLTYKPQTKAVVRCMKFKGMTIRLGEDGQTIIESDIPEQQEALKNKQQMVNDK